ncbi:hypothetical protein [Azospirillum argentinense]
MEKIKLLWSLARQTLGPTLARLVETDPVAAARLLVAGGFLAGLLVGCAL